MATLVLDVEDALLQRISSIAAERGENTAQYVVELVKRDMERQEVASGAEGSLADELQGLTGLVDSRKTPSGVQSSGDFAEEYLAKHWADDLSKGSMNKE